MNKLKIVEEGDTHISRTTHAGRIWCFSIFRFAIFIQNFSQVIRQKNFLRKNLGYIFTLIISIAMLCSCNTTQNILCFDVIVSLRQFDSKGIIMYYVASEGLCYDVLMTKLRLRCIFPRAKLSEMRM